MNTVTVEEVRALEAVVPAQSLLLVPLSLLRPSRRNVRKTGGTSVAELSASIRRVGLLQNLTVTQATDGEHYEVVAGGRRLAALRRLAKRGQLPADYEVPCVVVADAAARTASLTENVQREAMHPADQFEAFAALVEEGRSIEEIAADFGVTPLVVRRRLKLANVSPRLLADYRAGEVGLDQLMALAITDDHAAQEAAFYEAPEWQRSPDTLREQLTDRDIDAGRDPLARFVGRAAYEAGGGGVRQDLFADGDRGVYLTDAALLDRLAVEKLAAVADGVRGEGWAWVEVAPRASYADLQEFRRAPRERRQPTAREARQIAKLQARLQDVEADMRAAMEAGDEDRGDALHDEGYRLGEQLDDIEAELMDYGPAVRAAAGAVVTLDYQGEPVIHRGLLREVEAKALQALAKAQGRNVDGADSDECAKAKRTGLSEKLVRRLSAHRTAALHIELARRPQVALAALAHGLVQRVVQDGYGADLPVQITATPQDRLVQHAEDLPQSPAFCAMQAVRQAWGERLPGDSEALFAALLALPLDELVGLLADCVACTVDAVALNEASDPAAALTRAVGLDMRNWWTPTADGYFVHVPKAAILDAVRQFAPDQVTRLAKLKKADLAGEAERLAVGTGWMPVMFAVQAAEPNEAGIGTKAEDTPAPEEEDTAA